MVPLPDDIQPPPEKPKAPHRDMATKILKMSVFVDNALHPEVQARFVPQGYGPPKIAQGRTLWQDAHLKYDRNHVLEADAERKTVVLMEKWKEVEKKWSLFVDAAYATMRARRDLLDALGLVPRAPASQTFAYFVNRARSAYEVAIATPEIQTFLAGRGYDMARLNQERMDVQQLIAFNDAQEAAKGLAQASTHDLKAAMDGMWRWYGDGAMMARRALRDRHDLLEMLGIVALERKRKKKPV
jgi:hypothetical protein